MNGILPPITLHRQVIGSPVQVGVSQGGLLAFMVGTQWVVTKDGQRLERPIVFVGAKATPIPSVEQWFVLPHLLRFSQPKTWTIDEAAIAHVMTEQLVDVASTS